MPFGGSPQKAIADSPRVISNSLLYWSRADFNTLNGSNAATLTDLSGNSLTATAIAGQQAAFGATSGPNNTPGLTFTGGQIYSTPSFNPAVNQIDVFYVVKYNNGATFQVVLDFSTAGQSTVGGFSENFSGAASPIGRHSNTAGANIWGAAAVSTPSFHIIESQHDKTQPAEQVSILTDGVLTAQTPTLQTGGTDLFGNFPLFIGARSGLLSGFQGVISEVFIYSGLLTAQQRSNLYRGYLGPRYGTAVP